MFATVGRMDIRDESVRVIYAHKPYVAVPAEYDSAAIADYREHFPQLDRFLDFLVAARFAQDRKRAYLWMQCPSDWGKGFLLDVFERFGASVELSVKEIEGIFEGRPVGRTMSDFKRAIILLVDEFKAVKSEVKQLQNTMTISPKNQLSVKVELFSKIFLSAEGVASLAGEHGVEDQFANRFSLLALEGNLETRPMFQGLGKRAYFDHLRAYVAEQLNSRIGWYVEQGRGAATDAADRVLTEVHSEWGIAHTHQRFSDSLPDLAAEFAAWAMDNATALGGDVIDGYYLRKPAKHLGVWLESNVEQSEKTTIFRKRDEIFKHVSRDGQGSKVRRLPQGTVKGVDLIKVNS